MEQGNGTALGRPDFSSSFALPWAWEEVATAGCHVPDHRMHVSHITEYEAARRKCYMMLTHTRLGSAALRCKGKGRVRLPEALKRCRVSSQSGAGPAVLKPTAVLLYSTVQYTK